MNKQAMVGQLRLLRQDIIALVQYSFDPLPGVSPLAGMCSTVAVLVQGMFGGDVLSGKVQGVMHYWNRLPGGFEADLTSCQFGGDGMTPLAKGRKVNTKVNRANGTRLNAMILAMKLQSFGTYIGDAS